MAPGHNSGAPANLHREHRRRSREQFLTYGADSFDDSRLLELYLFQSIPRRDVLPVVQELLHRFGTIRGVLQASEEELLSVPGVGEQTVLSLRLVTELNRRSALAASREVELIGSVGDAACCLAGCFSGLREERIYALCMDAEGRILNCTCLAQGERSTAAVSEEAVVQTAEVGGAVCVILAHNHLSGSTHPSAEDLECTVRIMALLAQRNVELVDHLIFAEDRWLSLRRAGYVRWD